MDPLQRFLAYAADFEKTYLDDDWTRLVDYFAPDAVYRVEGIPTGCEIRGRDAILAGIRRCLDGFDRRFDRRALVPSGAPTVDGSSVTIQGRLVYEKAGLPTLELEASETAELDAEGRIVVLRDHYPDGQDEALAWLERHGAGFDPSYE